MPAAAKWGNELLVNTNTINDQSEQSIAGLADGRFVVTWRDDSQSLGDTSSGAIHAQLFRADGVKVGPEFLVNSTTDAGQGSPAIAALTNGRFVITWHDSSGANGSNIRAQMYNADGSTFGGELFVNTTVAGHQTDPQITALANGRFVVTWEDDSSGNSNIRAQVYNANGTPSGAEFGINTATAGDQIEVQITALADGRFVAVWEVDDGEINAQIFEANGAKSGNEFQVTVPADYDPGSAVVSALGDGFVVVWIGGNDLAIRGQVFDKNGVKSGGELVIDTAAVNTNATQPTVTELADGRFVVAYVSAVGGGTSNIRAQVMNPDGSKSGAEFLVNTTVAGDQEAPIVTALADGRFVVSWTDHSQSGGDPSGDAVRSQIFDPREGAVGVAGTSLDDDLIGTAFDDVLVGLTGEDRLDGAGGNDTLKGGGGNDTLIGRAGDDFLQGDGGADTYHGGSGKDTVSYAGATSGVTVNLATGFKAGVDAVGDVFSFIENLKGGQHGDTLTGDGLDNVLTGGGGNDVLDGAGGNDTAVFSGKRSDYLVYKLPNGDIQLIDRRTGSPDALDTVGGVETFTFADGSYSAGALLHEPSADLDGNFDSDVLWRHDDGTVGEWLMDNGQVAGTAQLAGAPNDWSVQGMGDFNGDGNADILWRHDGGDIGTWHMDGAQVLSTQVFANAPNQWHVQGVADFNGDGKDDLLWRHDDGTVGTWHMNGAQTLSTQTFANAPPEWHIQGTGDFNGDGKADLLWRHNDGTVGTWHMDGAQQLSTQAFANAPTDWHIEGVGDFNGDGKDDILWRNDNGTIGSWHMDGANQLSTQALGMQSADWHVEGIGDYNGDGKDDILWRNDNGTVMSWEMNGGQVTPHDYGVVANDWHIVGNEYHYI